MKRPELFAYALAALAVVGVVVCKLAGVEAPGLLDFVATTALGAGAGLQLPAPPAAAPAAPPAPAPAPWPVPLTSEPPTGVFRAATHAP